MKYCAVYAFHGDASAGQLSFQPGTMLVGPRPSESSNGWLHGHYEHSVIQKGWFPLSYVQHLPSDVVSEQATAVPTSNISFLDSTTTPDDDGFGAAPMGGDWSSSNNMARTNPFGSSTSFVTASPVDAQPQCYSSPVVNKSSVFEHHRPVMQKVGKSFSNVVGRAGSTISSAASRTGTAVSNATSETGHRLRDMQSQRSAHLDQTQVTYQETTKNTDANTTVSYKKEISPSLGFLPGRCSETATTQERGPMGASKTTTTATSRQSGGFFPGIRGKTVTTQTVEQDAYGNTQVQTETKSRGGFYIIPLGPVGLAAAGALAAKHAIDSNKDRKNTQQDS